MSTLSMNQSDATTAYVSLILSLIVADSLHKLRLEGKETRSHTKLRPGAR